ncbi:MAG: ATP-dependent helicase RecQ [Anaerophaga sp.]|nr:ATP-dependent helicase RecQ [Anaerophaga sp.]
MSTIVFLDTETEPQSHKILDMGCVSDDGKQLHSSRIEEIVSVVREADFLCGHNFLNYDWNFLRPHLQAYGFDSSQIIDTLFLSPLLFPARPYHALLKDDKILNDELNNPLSDAIKARLLFDDEVSAFWRLKPGFRELLFLLLHNRPGFAAFFSFVEYEALARDAVEVIGQLFHNDICLNADIKRLVADNPVELAYTLALINSQSRYSITPPWVLKNFPEVESVFASLRNHPCIEGCDYCRSKLDARQGLKTFFGFNSFRTYEGSPLQEQAVRAALEGKSLLAVFPTGGGKSVTFQLPALMQGESVKGLTVVISPLQSLMKDQVDNLEKQGITEAVTINGLLDPIERANSLERVEDGSASILYISPESLRSMTIERALLGRNVVRFVIDEAHCFSSWGQDFRVDYLYIGEFIKSLTVKKNLDRMIPVSCFTATAKNKVIDDIRAYFLDKLSLNLTVFRAAASRKNLHYKVIERDTEESKYQTVRLLIEEKQCPTIIYVSRTHRAYKLAKRLADDGIDALPYHGKMPVDEKTANQNAFLGGEVSVMVATSAFGMGVDKKDVGMVVHFDISDSLENYIQEAGRAGRDENISADCYVLFNEDDLGKHFVMLNQTKLSIREIQQVWKAIKETTRFRKTVSNSALEIARKAGWDDEVMDIENRVTAAIAALEDAGYIKRGQNMPRIFANSILSRNAQDAIDKIYASARFDEKQKEKAIRIIRKLFSARSRKEAAGEEGETRIDYFSDHLGIVKEEVIRIIGLLREEKILADTKDLTAFIRKGENSSQSQKITGIYRQLERFLLPRVSEEEKTYHIKELNELAEEQGIADITPDKIKTVLNFWAIKNWIKKKYLEGSGNHLVVISQMPIENLIRKMEKRHILSGFVIDYLFGKSNEAEQKDQVLVNFSVHELKEAYEQQNQLFKENVSLQDIEDTLFYLSRIGAIRIEGGFLVIYNKLTIDRLEEDNKIRYKNEDYQKLKQHYENKTQQIHIVGEYARKMVDDYKGALQFVDDYFQLNYDSFLNKYFPGSRKEEIHRSITPARFHQLFGELSAPQLNIIKDNQSPYIAVAAGPGSGKTKILVHKLASLLLMEDVKQEQLLMLTFSRAAATEFKKRILQMIGNAANFLEIKTFHSYCFDLLGRVGTLEKAETIIETAVERIKSGDIEPVRIAKTVLVIDEAQDMNAAEYALVEVLMDKNPEMRVVAVGDDDQNIYEFRGGSAAFLERFIREKQAVVYQLTENFRSKRNLVHFTNAFASTISHRLKTIPVEAGQTDNGNIRIIRHQSEHQIVPLVRDILNTPLKGTTGVLTRTNNEALQVTGLLIENGMKARLVQSNEGFSLASLDEIRFFCNQLAGGEHILVIDDDAWQHAVRKLKNAFSHSSNLELCLRLIADFEAVNTAKKYFSDFEIFLQESRLEDFTGNPGETIIVSTMHKAKGKEYDNVFLMPGIWKPVDDEQKRLMYVAMTRAKSFLSIHLRGDWLDGAAFVDGLKLYSDSRKWELPDILSIQLTHKDVWLGFFKRRQRWISNLVAGDELKAVNQECRTADGQVVLRFSRRFQETVDSLARQGYVLKDARISFVVWWNDEEEGKEIRIVLPQVHFEIVKQPYPENQNCKSRKN